MSSAQDDTNYYRTKSDIIVSCSITLLTGAWVVIHPNLSYPVDMHQLTASRRYFHTLWTLIYRRISLIAIFIIFPEFILVWAFRQNSVASKMAKNRGWTKTHAHLAIMGGFHVFDQGKPWYPVENEDLVHMVNEGLRLPALEEIKDKSKDTHLITTAVFVQVLWFALHCIARASQSLRLSKLEILTVAYLAALGTVLCAWRDKPRNIDMPFKVPTSYAAGRLPQPPQSTVEKEGYVSMISEGILGFGDTYANLCKSKAVPMFYGGDRKGGNRAWEGFYRGWLVGAMFAAINCITWSYPTPSSSLTALVIWRLCCLSNIWVCVSICGFFAWLAVMEGMKVVALSDLAFNIFAGSIVLIMVFIYVLARITMIVLAVRELVVTPTDYETVPWTDFIPHI